ncbi:hypothetical protein D3C87_1815030 [compost metagenome]
MRVAEHIGEIVDGSAGNTDVLERREPMSTRFLFQRHFDARAQQVAMEKACGICLEAGVRCQFFPLGNCAEALKLGVVANGQNHRLV